MPAKNVAKKSTTKTVAFTVSITVHSSLTVRDAAQEVRRALDGFKPRVTPIKEA